MSRTVEEIQTDVQAFARDEVRPTISRWGKTLDSLIQELTDLLPSDADEYLQALATGEKAPSFPWAMLDRLINISEGLFGGLERALARVVELRHEDALRVWVEKRLEEGIGDEAARGVALEVLAQLSLRQRPAPEDGCR